MNKESIKLVRLLVVLLFLMLANDIYSRKLPGYIVTEKNDTLWGRVKVNTFNPRSGAFSFNQINLETCYWRVAFCEQVGARYKFSEPEEIRAFAFKFKGQEYFFHRFQVIYNSIIKSEENRYEFLNLIKRTKEISIYRGLHYVITHQDKHTYNIYDNTSFLVSVTFGTSDDSVNKIYDKTSNIVPSYTYYQHNNGSERVIIHKDQSVEKKDLVK